MPGEYDNILYSGTLLQIGSFDCPRHSPNFNNTGPIQGYLLAFPRTAVKIRHAEMDEAFVADPNTVTIYNKGQEYERYALSDYGDRCDWLALCPSVACEILSDIGFETIGEPENIFSISHGTTSIATYTGFRKLTNNIVYRGDLDNLHIEENALNIFRNTLCETHKRSSRLVPRKPHTTHKKHKKIVQSCVELLASQYTESLSLHHIAQTLNTSAYHLCRVFREVAGLTIHQYLSQLRLRSALHSLTETDADLSTLGLSLGFSDHSHFSSYFRKAFGETPSMYRRNAISPELSH